MMFEIEPIKFLYFKNIFIEINVFELCFTNVAISFYFKILIFRFL